MKNKRKSYDSIFKEKAVLLSFDRKNIGRLEIELNLYTGALYKWRSEYASAGNLSSAEREILLVKYERQKIHNLKEKIARTDLKADFLKNARDYINQGNNIIFPFMQSIEKLYSIRLMCEVLNINRTTYHSWKHNLYVEKKERELILKREITSIFLASECRYGKDRIRAALQKSGYKVCRKTIAKYMKELGLMSKLKAL